MYLNTNVFVTRCFIFDQKYCFVSEPKHFFIHIFHILFCTWLNIFHISYYIILYLNPNLFSYIFAKHFVLYLIKHIYIVYLCLNPNIFLGFLFFNWPTIIHIVHYIKHTLYYIFVPESKHFSCILAKRCFIFDQKIVDSPDTTRPEVDKHIVKKVPVEELHSERGSMCVEIWNRNCLCGNRKKKFFIVPINWKSKARCKELGLSPKLEMKIE